MRLPLLLLLPFALAACDRGQPVRAAAPMATTSQAVTVGGATLQASTVALADLTPAVATRYGIATGSEGALLLVTVRDADGNALAPGDLALQATATVLPDPPAPPRTAGDPYRRARRLHRRGPRQGAGQRAVPAQRHPRRIAREMTTTADVQPR